MLLSFDLTFLAVVLLSLKNLPVSFKKGRCPFNPAKRCNYCSPDGALSFAAAATVIMFYYKLKDNIKDSGFFKKLSALLLLPYSALLRRRAKKKYPRLEEIVSENMKKQLETENGKTDSFDMAAHASADALGKIFSLGYGKDKDGGIYRFGYAVGRWVYLLDAADDLESDRKTGSFNVLINRFGVCPEDKEKLKAEIEATLNMSRAQAIEAYRASGAEMFRPIVENVLFDGMEYTANKVLKGNPKDERSL